MSSGIIPYECHDMEFFEQESSNLEKILGTAGCLTLAAIAIPVTVAAAVTAGLIYGGNELIQQGWKLYNNARGREVERIGIESRFLPRYKVIKNDTH